MPKKESTDIMLSILSHCRLLGYCALAFLSGSASLLGSESAVDTPPSGSVRLPGIEIHAERGIVDVDARICLTEGMLELVACTEGTKEHESIVAIKALPVHVHTALLLIGARNGTPAMREPINEEQTRWRHYRPSGDPITVSLVVQDDEGNPVERPISDFVRRGEGESFMPNMGRDQSAPGADEANEKFPDAFLFTGSHLVGDDAQGRQYLADQSGHVITISTFGDEVLGLSEIHSHTNDELVWEVDPTHLPALDTAVKLRLRLKR